MTDQKSTILIVDDQPMGRETLEALLDAEGYELTFACNGPEAPEKAAVLNPGLILLDVMMPDMDGFDVCRRLRADPALAEVPIIMVTALDDRDPRLRGHRGRATLEGWVRALDLRDQETEGHSQRVME